MATKKLTYEDAFDQLQIILKKIESGELNVDQLAAHVKMASELIQFCKSRLYETESEIEQILKDLDAGD